MTETHFFDNRKFCGVTVIAEEAMCRAFHDRHGQVWIKCLK